MIWNSAVSIFENAVNAADQSRRKAAIQASRLGECIPPNLKTRIRTNDT